MIKSTGILRYPRVVNLLSGHYGLICDVRRRESGVKIDRVPEHGVIDQRDVDKTKRTFSALEVENGGKRAGLEGVTR